ncbi:hypothetical protein ACFP1Z_10845 [Streptomyces gamaensis]|uniref:Uncharacterized protein n=1 Tax=Streptomyces gamaensis TaxID=1763542 RepID=A0ABW0Z2R7_9ACTN
MADTPNGKAKKRRTQPRVQNDVLRASMADAFSGSFLNSGSDSTAALLEQMKQSGAVSAQPDSGAAAAPESAPAPQASAVATAPVEVPSPAPAPEPAPAPLQAAAPAPVAVPEPPAPVAPAPAPAPVDGPEPARHGPVAGTDGPSAEPSLPAARSEKAEPKAAAAPAPAPAPAAAEVVVEEPPPAAAVPETPPTVVPAPEPAPAPAPAPAPVPAPPVAAPAPVTAVRAPEPAQAPAVTAPQAAAPQPAGAWAHAALQDSFLDNRINSHDWDTWGFRLVPDVKKRLEARLSADKRSSNNRRLAQGHYVNAAMLRLPQGTDEQLALIREFMLARGGYTDPGKPSNYRVSRQVWEVARDLDMDITAAAKRGLVVFLFSAAVERLLDSLDQEGPLARPEVFRRVQ